jgi:HAE1 family hydrophobic/amphiphilic exporter-1
MNLPELCIRRPVMTTLVTAAIMVFGVVGYRQLPISALPKVDFPTIVITASLNGASAETMASSVATQIEKKLSAIGGIVSLSSSSVLSESEITVQFELDRNIDGAALDVQSALSSAQRVLPPEMTVPPSFRKVNPSEAAVLNLSVNSKTLALSEVHEYAETTIAQRLSMLAGVAQVTVFGGQKFAVRVQVNPDAMAARDIDFPTVQAAVTHATTAKPVGRLSGPQSLTLKASAGPTHAAQYAPLIVAYRNGSPVRLRDIANVVDSIEDDKVASWYNDARTISVFRQPGANTVEVVNPHQGIAAGAACGDPAIGKYRYHDRPVAGGSRRSTMPSSCWRTSSATSRRARRRSMRRCAAVRRSVSPSCRSRSLWWRYSFRCSSWAVSSGGCCASSRSPSASRSWCPALCR